MVDKVVRFKMTTAYDTYYKVENLFGDPYPELIHFFKKHTSKGKVLDLGCGQGRNAIPLARIGFDVLGIDNSKVGIDQMNQTAKTENLPLEGIVTDIFQFENYSNFDFVLLDSMFHFTKKNKQKEILFIKKIISKIIKNCVVIFCIQDTGKKVEILNGAIHFKKSIEQIVNQKFEYLFEDTKSGHKSKTNYRMIIIKNK